MVVSDVRKHPTPMDDASKAYAESMRSTVKFLLSQNDQMEKDLQESRQKTEQSKGSAMVEMRKVILAKLATLQTTMWKL